jgi:DNA-binding protein HU-beta
MLDVFHQSRQFTQECDAIKRERVLDFIGHREALVAQHAGLAKTDAAKAVDAVFASIEGALKSGDEVRLVGFGTFSVTKRPASEGRNPRTGDKIQIAASTQPKFKAGKGLKDAVN